MRERDLKLSLCFERAEKDYEKYNCDYAHTQVSYLRKKVQCYREEEGEAGKKC